MTSPAWPETQYDFRVESAAKAVALALQWKNECKYKAFRGQSRPWALAASLARVKGVERDAAQRQLGKFVGWARSIGPLRDADEIQLMAIAQHYGIPTPLIDFTMEVDVAAYFATHREDQQPGEMACLVCLPQEDDIRLIDSMACANYKSKMDAPPPFPMCQVVNLHVPDLWRLQAQAGLFLELHGTGVECLFPPDRILFPFSEPWSAISTERIYPKDRSSLEVLLDEYFERERREAGHALMMSIVEGSAGRIVYHEIEEDPEERRASHARASHARRWLPEEIAAWTKLPDEHWASLTADDALLLDLELAGTNADRFAQLKETFLSSFRAHPAWRKTIVRFRVRDPAGVLPPAALEKINVQCNRVVNGLRPLPYTDEQVGICLARIASWIETAALTEGFVWTDFHGSIARILPSALQIEFVGEAGFDARAYVPVPVLIGYLRPEIAELLDRDPPDWRSDFRVVLLAYNDPQILFSFADLVQLFADYIIPCQAWRASSEDALLYSPARLTVFGIP
jgi:hypothetical protein